ncbi:ABC transporter, ATP binding protein [Aeropyrum pernix K1]|uniref:ABC transporter, ATP binding protein n=1 Tax=Aeropyrum pernix (strain ATCC 700893 / DSM 11879 / JCM 9820 / NBRC 100138 / K1) TaxID=272557 RepID=Q9YAK6_AERPE|nr:ABC transporter ATP-binding protein [Aeropyrum pernix]BAA80943.2 ABC transporter, ATP binding protein [Aeropyrum pernix K1]
MDKNSCACLEGGYAACLCGVAKSVKGRPVLRGVSLSVKFGEIHVLAGLNGAGKTTSLRVLVGLLSRDSGEARVLGVDPWGGGFERVKGEVGYLPEDASVYERLTGMENILFYARLYSGWRDVEELVENAVFYSGLSREDLARRAGGYSKGMKRRLLLGITLMSKPRLVVLDEPTSGVDPIASNRIKKILRGLSREGRAILVTTHDLALAEEIADRVTIIHGGSTVASGPPYRLVEEYCGETLEDAFVNIVTGGGC